MNRINDKILEIEKFLEELEILIPGDLEEYQTDFKIKAACERFIEKTVEAVVDLAFLIIKDKKLKQPKNDKNAFDILFDEKIISNKICEKIKDAKSMKNIISHQYGKINDEIIFNSLKEELIKDINQFIKEVSK